MCIHLIKTASSQSGYYAVEIGMPITTTTYGFIPTQLTGCVQWLDGADNTTIYSTYPGTLAVNSATVTQWNDKSGAGNHVYQNGASACPTFTLASNALNFAGGGGLWNSVGYALSSNVSFFTVMISPGTGWGTWGTLWGHFRSGGHDADIQFRQESITNGYVSWHTNNNNNNYLAIPTAGTKVMYSCTMSNGVNMFLQNSYSGSTTSSTYTEGTMTIAGGTVAPFWIGRSDSSEVYNGYICEIVYYNQKLSDTQRQQVESYLAQKWGLKASLSIGHPGLTTTVYQSSYLKTAGVKTNIARMTQFYTAFTPRQIGGCILWLDAADASTITTSSTTVTGITDKSTRATVLTSPAGFTYPNNTFNGSYPSFYNTNASGGRLGYNTSFSLGSQNTIFIVGQLTSPSVGNQFFDFIDGYGSSSRFFLFSSPNYLNNYVYGTNGSTSGQVSGAVTTAQMTAPFCWSVAFDTSTTISSTLQYVNGTQLVESPSTLGAAIASYTGIIIGQRYTQSSESVVGHICEFIIYNSVLSLTQRQQVESYLAQKWGLTSSLPAGHLHLTQPAGAVTSLSLANSKMTKLSIVATGGSVTITNGYKIHTFTTVGTTNFVVTSGGTAQVLVVGGGGAGASGYESGGGGAGGAVFSTITIAASTYVVTVGDGGAGAVILPRGGQGASGTNSSFSTLTGNGGGGGGNYGDIGVGSTLRGTGGQAANGGCGGGGGGNGDGGVAGTAGTGNQGFGGGTSTNYGGSGGGGMGSAGSNATTSAGANGGLGLTYTVGGNAYLVCGGGGGGSELGAAGGSGGSGIGGNGGVGNNTANGTAPTSGTVNTGSGGGGSYGYTSQSHAGGSGGSGIVIIAYIYP